MNEGTLRFKFSAGITIEQPQAYFSMFPLRHITNFLLVDVNITNDEYLQIVPKLHLLAMLTRVDFSKNKLRIKDAADNEMVVSTKALLDAITSIITIELVGNDINSSYIATTMNSEQLKKLKIAAEK